MRTLLKRLRLVPLAILAIILVSTVVLAGIAPPTSITLLGCNAYESLIEENDQLYLMYYNVAYSVYPTETINETFYVALTDADTSIDLAITDIFANPYFHNGYGRGIVSMYFTASEVSAVGLTWGDNYTMRLIPSATANWTAVPPTTVQSIVWSGTGLTARLFYIINQLQNQWGVNLIDSGTLTAYGENYAISTIPNLRLMAPTIFGSYSIPISYDTERTHTLTYALTLRNQWIGTWLDLTPVATDWGIDAIWIYGFIWIAVMVAVGWIAVTVGGQLQPVGIPQTAHTTKPLLYVELLVIVWGGLMGFLPWLAAILSGVVMAIVLINQLFFSKASA